MRRGTLAWLGLAPLYACTAEPVESPDSAVATELPAPVLAPERRLTDLRGALVGEGPDGSSVAFTSDGAYVESGDDDVALRFIGWGRDGDVRPLDDVPPTLGDCLPSGEVDLDGGCLARAEYDHGDAIEWWGNRDVGLQHAWDLLVPPAGEGPVVLQVAVEGAVPLLGPDGAVALLEASGRSWRYGDVRAWDAAGEPLDAHLRVTDGNIEVVVDADGAEWPVYVDPILGTLTRTFGMPEAQARMGFSIATGDFNGDGWPDLFIGAPYWGLGPSPEAGVVWLYLGSPLGYPTNPSQQFQHPESSNAPYDHFGWSITTGRLNGDPYDDLVVGAPGYRNDQGAAWVFLGSASPNTLFEGRLEGQPTNDQLCGYAVATGNIDGSLYDEVVMGCPGEAYSGPDSGRAYLCQDPAGNWGSYVKYGIGGGPGGPYSYIGAAVAVTSGVRNFNGDPFDDIVIGGPGQLMNSYGNGTGSQGAYAYLGKSSLSSVGGPQQSYNLGGGRFGETIAITEGSLDDDGATDHADLIVGMPGNGPGRFFVFRGNGGGPPDSGYDLTVGGEGPDDEFGSALATGDYNNDGFDDLLVGSSDANHQASRGGRVAMFDGGPGIDPGVDWSYASSLTDERLGDAVHLRDVDGDGLDELFVGATLSDVKAGDAGLVYQFDTIAEDIDLDGFTTTKGDCNDNDKTIYPGAPETTYGIDRDCDNNLLCYRDLDQDGYGALPLVEEVDGDKNCDEVGQKTADDNLDCDDSSPFYRPGLIEDFYLADRDCDGRVGCYADNDLDGFGSAAIVEDTNTDKNCDDKVNKLANDSLDCSDVDPGTFPSAPELTFGFDKDCDNNLLCYEDVDQDTFGSSKLVEEIDGNKNCNEPGQRTADDPGDCDDAASKTNPAGVEDTYLVDRNCNSKVACYYDGDQDAFGISKLVEDSNTDKNCDDKVNKLANDPDDCADGDALRFPGALEVAYGQDRDCDGQLTCYQDLDQDKFGSNVLVEETDGDKNCDEYADKVANDSNDCLDNNPLAYLGATEAVGDGVDQSCDGVELCYADVDKDTWGAFTTKSESADVDLLCETAESEATKSGDCNDNNASIGNTGIPEVVGNGSDEDCDSFDQCYADTDKDGHAPLSGKLVADFGKDGCLLSQGEGGAATAKDDCDDAQSTVYTGAPELVADGFDNDCNGSETCYADVDRDGHVPTSKVTRVESVDGDFICESGDSEGSAVGPFDDCDDASSVRYPGNPEFCGNGIDENCDGIGHGSTADDDKDGVDFGKESVAGANDCAADSDGDGVLDFVEFGPGATALNTDKTDQADILDLDDDNDGVATKTEGGVADTDKDGIANFRDSDDDGDGVLSASEGAATSLDTDKDTVVDYLDVDDDGDGINTVTEGVTDADLDGIKNYLDGDDDGDGVATKFEGPVTKDSDLDKTPNYLDTDDDADGVATKVEGATADTDADSTLDYLDTDDDGDNVPSSVEGAFDLDGDKVLNYLDADDDGDGLTTLAEDTNKNFNPGDDDTDADGVPNYRDADDDGDGVSSLAEGAKDSDVDGAPDYLDSDDDGDGRSTLAEGSAKDTDKDTVFDYLDSDDDGDGVATKLEGAPLRDTDGDGVIDALDDDDDDDGLPTSTEDANSNGNWLDDDADLDAIVDYRDDDNDNDDDPDRFDCDDNDPTVASGATELCDAIDQDCDGDVFESFPDTDSDLTLDCDDDDDDGDGDPDATDCEDLKSKVYTGAPEICNGVDDDCDGAKDDGATGAVDYYEDKDNDGFGGKNTVVSCSPPVGFVLTPGDCDDARKSANPAGEESCAAGDEDCDGAEGDSDPEGTPSDAGPWYLDGDSDTWGDPAAVVYACIQPGDATDVSVAKDCDDTNPFVSPSEPEVCNNDVDDDCDGIIDTDATQSLWYPDVDKDDHGDEAATAVSDCARPTDMVSSNDDCDDADADVNPELDEVLDNGKDDDCDPSTPDVTDTGVVDTDTDVPDTDPVDTDTDVVIDTDTDVLDTDSGRDTAVPEPPSIVCGCGTGAGGGAWLALVGLLLLRRRSR